MRNAFLFILSLFLLCPGKVCAQSSGVAISGKKDKTNGYQKVFLDEKATPTDSSNACFFGYEFYDNGKPVFKVFPKSKSASHQYVFEGTIPAKGNPVAINGTLKRYQVEAGKEDLLLGVDVYQNGYPVTLTEYGFRGEIWYICDFTKLFENQIGTFFMTNYYTYLVTTEKRQKTTYSWFRKKGRKWKAVKVE